MLFSIVFRYLQHVAGENLPSESKYDRIWLAINIHVRAEATPSDPGVKWQRHWKINRPEMCHVAKIRIHSEQMHRKDGIDKLEWMTSRMREEDKSLPDLSAPARLDSIALIEFKIAKSSESGWKVYRFEFPICKWAHSSVLIFFFIVSRLPKCVDSMGRFSFSGCSSSVDVVDRNIRWKSFEEFFFLFSVWEQKVMMTS